MAARTILIGLGNPIMSDDAIGIRVAEEVLRLVPGLEGDLSASGGFDVLDCVIGYDRAVIIDAMVTGKFPPGTVRRVDVDPGLQTQRTVYSHGMNFLRAIEVGRVTGAEKVGDIAGRIARDLQGGSG